MQPVLSASARISVADGKRNTPSTETRIRIAVEESTKPVTFAPTRTVACQHKVQAKPSVHAARVSLPALDPPKVSEQQSRRLRNSCISTLCSDGFRHTLVCELQRVVHAVICMSKVTVKKRGTRSTLIPFHIAAGKHIEVKNFVRMRKLVFKPMRKQHDAS